MPLVLIASTQVSATMLSGALNVDNGYVAYLATDNHSQGVQVSAANNWYSTYTFSGVNLVAGQDYFYIFMPMIKVGLPGFWVNSI